MKNILEIVNELQNETGKLKKEAVLKREINNESFKDFIRYTLDPMNVYGIQAKKLNRFLGKTDGESQFEYLSEVFEYLLKNNTGRDVDAEIVAKFIDSEENEELKELYAKAITKTLRMGIDTTINRVWGKGFISEFKLMLAKDFYKEMHKIKGKDFTLTEKVDGMRSAFFVKDGEVKVFSRQGKPITGLVELEEEFSQLVDGVYDGEILVKNEHLHQDRAVLQETLKIARKDGDKTGLNFHVFDYLSLEEFEKGESEHPYKTRRQQLSDLLDNESARHIHLLPVLYEGSDLEIVPKLLKKLEDEGKEGLMLNLSNKKYVSKRTNFIVKIKSMSSFDEKCTGVFEGEGKYKGMLGGITVDYKGYPLRIGSGFTDEQRKLYWNNPELIVSSIVEVQYFRESSNADGGLSVSFPVFLRIREGKTEASYH